MSQLASESCTATLVPSAEIDGRFARGRKQTSKCLFGRVAELVWDKPDTAIAVIANVSDRAARDYLNGKVPAPSIVIAALIVEITKRV